MSIVIKLKSLLRGTCTCDCRQCFLGKHCRVEADGCKL